MNGFQGQMVISKSFRFFYKIKGAYAGACLVVFIMGFLSEAIKAFRCFCDKFWKKQSAGYANRVN
jgi:hypothetical protein